MDFFQCSWNGERRQSEYPDCEWFFHIAGQRFVADALETEWDRVRKACGIPMKARDAYDARRTHSHLLEAHHVTKDDKTQMGHDTDGMSYAYNEGSIAQINRTEGGTSTPEGSV